MNQKKISVCVPSYNRPETIRQLINSFKNQTYPNKELVICDDSPTDNVSNIVDELNDGSIYYYHNKPGLGFPKNFLECLMKANGDYRLTIGDDDILASITALEEYVNVFETNPKVGFVYCNQIQFNNDFQVECEINKFKEDTLFNAGKSAVENLLIHSIFIGGQAFRGDTDFRALYPEREILHPQVQLVGNILATRDGYGLSEYAIGVRSHQDQIIFRALKDKSIQRDGKHMNIELIDIFDGLKAKWQWDFSSDFLVKQLIKNYPVVMIKERIILGFFGMRKCYKDFCNKSYLADRSVKLRVIYIFCLVSPVALLALVRWMIMKSIQLQYTIKFSKLKANLQRIVT